MLHCTAAAAALLVQLQLQRTATVQAYGRVVVCTLLT
jgi:hypothetical protein